MPVLTDISIKALPLPENGAKTYIDDTLAGFGVRVSAGGTKSFVLVYGKARKRVNIGRVGIITLKDARAKAKTILAEKTLGRHDLPTLSFGEALDIFFPTLAQRNRPSTEKTTRRLLTKHFLPPLRHEHLTKITTHNISEILDRLKDTPSEANHAHAAIRLFFRWAERRNLVHKSPCSLLQAPSKHVSRDRVLSDTELISVYRTASLDASPFGRIVQLLILTAQRRGEITALEEAWIDQEGKTVTLPARITKNKQGHTFPFGDLAAPLLAGKGRLFPARGGSDRPFSGWSKCKARLDEASKVSDWTLHDLRRTVSTNLGKLGVPIHVTEKLLNHISGTTGGIVRVYNRHTYLPEMRAAVKAWEERLTKLLETA